MEFEDLDGLGLEYYIGLDVCNIFKTLDIKELNVTI